METIVTDLQAHSASPARQVSAAEETPHRPQKAFGIEEAELWRQTNKERKKPSNHVKDTLSEPNIPADFLLWSAGIRSI